MANPNGIQTTVVIAVVGFCILAIGFLAGRAIGGGGDEESLGAALPTGISTRQSSVQVPTLGSGEGIPTLEVTQASSEPAGEEGALESATSSEPEVEFESPESSPEQAPEVTVAPNG